MTQTRKSDPKQVWETLKNFGYPNSSISVNNFTIFYKDISVVNVKYIPNFI